ncbi:MAG: M23 family metallopeptidase [bacterium]|nr:M23 family metallopeptidase [bacterium]
MSEKEKKSAGFFGNFLIIIISFSMIIGGLVYYSGHPSVPVTAASKPNLLPVSGNSFSIVSSFGKIEHPISGIVSNNQGIDFAVSSGSPVYASGGGEALIAGQHGRYGLTVLLQHPDNYTTMYSNLGLIKVNVGDIVREGEIVGLSLTAEQGKESIIHFEIRKDGKPLNPVEEYDLK